MLNKFLKGIIVFVLLSLVYAIYIGMTNKGDVIITELEIDAPAEVVYSYLTDAEKSKEWLTGMKSIERISGEDLAVGSKYRIVFAEGKRDMVMTETLTAVKENEQFAFTLEDDFMTGEIDITLTPTTSGTLVREVNTYRGNNFMARMMTGLFKRSIRKGKQEMYDKLKEVAEN